MEIKRNIKITSLKVNNKDLKETIKSLNKCYSREDMNIQVRKKGMYLIKNGNNKGECLCNFGALSKKIIVYVCDNERRRYGIRLQILYKKNKKKFRKINFNISDKELESKNWINDILRDCCILFNDKNYNYLKNAIKVSCKLLNKKDVKIYTNSIGWIKGNEEWYYVPNTCFSNEKALVYDESFCNKYKILCKDSEDKVSESIDFDEGTEKIGNVYNEVIEMLNVADKKITIPVLSYTILSSILSLIKCQNQFPNIYLNIYGLNNDVSSIEIANIFANIFRRTKFIEQLDYEFHIKIDQDCEEIKTRLSLMRDCVVFISDVDANNEIQLKKVKEIINFANSKKIVCGIIFLSNNSISYDSILNLDITNSAVSTDILKKCKEEPETFSIFYTYFVNSFKTYLDKGEEIDYMSRYRNICSKFEDDDLNMDVNLINKVSWLFIGYKLIIKCKFCNGRTYIIEPEDKREELLNEGFDIFRRLCAYTTANVDNEIKNAAKILLKCIKEIINNNNIKILDDYDDYSSNKTFSGWCDDEAYYFKLNEMNESIKKCLSKDDSQQVLNKYKDTNFLNLYENLYENSIIKGQYENIKNSDKKRFRPDYNVTIGESKKDSYVYIKNTFE